MGDALTELILNEQFRQAVTHQMCCSGASPNGLREDLMTRSPNGHLCHRRRNPCRHGSFPIHRTLITSTIQENTEKSTDDLNTKTIEWNRQVARERSTSYFHLTRQPWSEFSPLIFFDFTYMRPSSNQKSWY